LRRRSDVVRFGLAADAGSWGATLVELTRPVSGAAERVDRDG
jgi:hypothetical protein